MRRSEQPIPEFYGSLTLCCKSIILNGGRFKSEEG
jgi:hypothetical protein